MNFQNKIALVTGSTSGIGKATAQRLLDEGATVIVSGTRQNQDDVLSGFINREKAIYIPTDISKREDIENLKKQIEELFGRLDYLVSSAGIIPRPCKIDEINDESIERVITVNQKGTFWTVKILGEFIQTTSSNGAIVTLTSVDGIIGEPYAVMYSATKAGIISLTKSFARYFNNPLVRVNAVAPGLIDTPLTASTGEDPHATTDVSIIQRMGKPEEIANAIVFLLSDEASFITGQILAVDGGFTLK